MAKEIVRKPRKDKTEADSKHALVAMFTEDRGVIEMKPPVLEGRKLFNILIPEHVLVIRQAEPTWQSVV